MQLEVWRDLTVVFVSIILEALPFVLLAVLVASAFHVFVSPAVLERLLPRQMGLQLIAASLLGLLVPVCECGIVPVTRRLLGKGIPLATGITFMLAAPVVNPIVAYSTYVAFPGQPAMVLYRLGGALVVALTVGLVLDLFFPRAREVLRTGEGAGDEGACPHGCDDHQHEVSRPWWQRLPAVLEHAGQDFIYMGRFLVLGAFLAAVVQTAVPHEVVAPVGGERVPSIVVMMALGYGLSLCSEADAFVAAAFSTSFTRPSIIAFMLFGPMTDVKNTLMLLGVFKTRFVGRLLALIAGCVFLYAWLLVS